MKKTTKEKQERAHGKVEQTKKKKEEIKNALEPTSSNPDESDTRGQKSA
jgi:hypothetical protein